MDLILASKGAKTVVETLLNVKEGEDVCIVTDTETFEVAKILATQTVNRGGEPVIFCMLPRKAHGDEPPGTIAEAMKTSQVIISPSSKSISHTVARKEAQKAGARHALMAEYTVDLLTSPALQVDFFSIRPKVERMAQLLTGARTARVRTAKGTDLTMNLVERKGQAYHGIAHEPGSYSTCQAIEANVSPLEGTSYGTIVVDGYITCVGLLEEPVKAMVEGGVIRDIVGGKEAEALARHLAGKNDPNVYNIAELGVPFNPQSRLIPTTMEGESVFGTLHIGIGSNITFGGKLHAKGHEDLVFWDPILELDGKVVLDKRELSI